MTRATVVLASLILTATNLQAQARVDVNTAVLYENYEFDPGLGFSAVSQLSTPLTLSTNLGRVGVLTLSSGFTRIDLTGSPDSGQDDRSLSGIVDTEARLILNLVPDRFNLLLTAIAPTGIEALEVEEGPMLTALSSQVIGFSTTNLGTGGAAGAGFAGAVPVGEMALGFAGSFTHAVAYSPVLGQSNEWKPGDEVRLRAGLEGTVGPDSYLRIASVFARRQKDQLDGEEQGGVGNRIHAYAALNQGIGAGTLTIYAFDSYRSAPQLESTPVGAVVLPKGNLVALGAKVSLPVARETRIMPRVEYRRFTEAPREGLGDGSLEAAGSTFRIGADLRQPINPRLAVILETSGLFGDVGTFDGSEIGVSGFRGGVHLEVRR